ncbi:hypothetical protein Y1Q_0011275 [Alligator mississippiensis]|uniref:Uncharacterized protein n=1 Tax=Alligator mississippiensis TaxID=8496 RepID=A0A151N864_ALLMI|nr:hypothetical protein Y1Q_0011275 [Alligator mississippiensis]
MCREVHLAMLKRRPIHLAASDITSSICCSWVASGSRTMSLRFGAWRKDTHRMALRGTAVTWQLEQGPAAGSTKTLKHGAFFFSY